MRDMITFLGSYSGFGSFGFLTLKKELVTDRQFRCVTSYSITCFLLHQLDEIIGSACLGLTFFQINNTILFAEHSMYYWCMNVQMTTFELGSYMEELECLEHVHERCKSYRIMKDLCG